MIEIYVGFIEIILVFAIGCLIGWILELGYRSTIEKKLVNPGFLIGPYLPIYGFGMLGLYVVSNVEINILLKVLLFGAVTTVVELITGLFFLNNFNMKLWDYSDKKLNYKGMICLEFSIYWTFLSLGFYYYIFPYLDRFVNVLQNSPYLAIFLGIFYGVIIVDSIISFNIASRIKKVILEFNKNRLSKIKFNYEMFRNSLSENISSLRGKGFFARFFLSIESLGRDLIPAARRFIQKSEKREGLKEKIILKKQQIEKFIIKKKKEITKTISRKKKELYKLSKKI